MKEERTKTNERAVIAGLSASVMPKEQRSDEDSLDELENLLQTAGGICCGRVFQQRQKPDPRSLLGAGKVDEMRMMIGMEDCSLAVFDNELTPSQIRALSADLGVRVIDRSALILDIFAQRAQTREGRLQVELAQYKYLLPRLTGMWTHLDRETASGGKSPIGTRGTGETQLESDRRYIAHRIEKLEKELEQVRKNRATQRNRRQKNGVPLVALVGYTNAGKSTLMNRLTHADIPANNRLFDTLDTTTRRLRLDNGKMLLFSDTVGFIRRLPHHLVEAFKSTLEELSYADIILHVIDPSHPQWQEKAEVAEKLIDQLARPETPRLRVFNKADLLDDDTKEMLSYEKQDNLFISALDGNGVEELLQRIDELTGPVPEEPWMQYVSYDD
ncbi:MAG: GTPase HflX [Firmicutes bacterium]|nr:GTPase HflX [Bacillota bacterium]